MPPIRPKFEYAIICDDIRQEIGNKVSYIGIYGSDIFVSKLPFTFPKLCFAVSYRNVKGEDSFSIEHFDSSGKQLGKTIKGIVTPDIKRHNKFVMFAIFSPLKVEQEGSYKLWITFNDDDKSKQMVEYNIKIAHKAQ